MLTLGAKMIVLLQTIRYQATNLVVSHDIHRLYNSNKAMDEIFTCLDVVAVSFEFYLYLYVLY